MARRRASSVDMGSALFYSKYLSKFQVEKFVYMFQYLFDLDKNQLIEDTDIVALGSKIQKFTGWNNADQVFKSTQDVIRTFLESVQDQVRAEKIANADADVIPEWDSALKPDIKDTESITLQQWLNMWGRLCYRSAGIRDFPCWVQLLPPIFFKTIDSDGDGEISIDELRRFYKNFVGIEEGDLEKTTQEGYRAMTAGGDYKLTEENFKFVWANFLLGRSIYGPGKYIFGVFDNRDMHEKYIVNYNDESDED